MAIRKCQSASSLRSKLSDALDLRSQAKARLRRMLMEHLEQRQLLAVGPQLIGIQPNSSDLLANGEVRTEAPRELVFRFDDSQVIDSSTLSGIRITSAGSDGTFGVNTAQSDFGSNGGANIQLSAVVPGQAWTIQVSHAVAAANTPPTIAVTGFNVAITLNTNPGGPTTANALIAAINGSSQLAGKLTAQLNGGLGTAALGLATPSTYSPIPVNRTNDTVLQPGAILVGESPNENEVTFRFAENLKDDNYRIEIFGFDDPVAGVVGLRNTATSGLGELFVPSASGTRKDTVDFRLDLGPQVTAVVPQPVVRVNGQLQQQRDTIVVYFDSDKLLVENNSAGQPTSRSVENPEFYQLIFTQDTVRNTDDTTILPTSVKYNAAANTATLRFATDINDLLGSNAGPATYRLRIGTRETTPATPTHSEGTANAITDLNTGGAVKLRLTSRQIGEVANGIQVVFVNSLSGTPSVTAAGNLVTVDLGRADLTAQDLLDLLQNSTASSNLFSTSFEPGSVASTIVGNANLAFSPVKLVGLGSSFDTATNLGVIGSGAQSLTSLILSSSIDPESFSLDLPGSSDDAAHRDLAQNLVGGFEDHVDPSFGADATDGITTIYYNFRPTYAQTAAGAPLNNAINADQKTRAREVLALWSKYIGVQFVETSDLGLTIAAGPVNSILPIASTTYRNEGNFGVRVDRTFQNSLVVLSATNTWGTEYGASYTRTMAAAVAMALGLQHAGDLPETTLMRLDPTFLSALSVLTDLNDAQRTASDEQYEPIVPGNQDIIHGRYLYRPDGSDIDLYRFEVDFGGGDQVGLLTAETYAQRLTNSSPLNTNLELFRETQATATTTFGASVPLSLRLEAVRPGAQGNQLQVFFTQTDRGNASKPIIVAFPNAISIDLNATVGNESTVQDIIDAINNSPAASSLVRVTLAVGSASTKVGNNVLTQNPVTLTGGGVELVSQNDDYFSQDSVLRQSLTSGVYYLGVSASGNANYNAAIPGSGFGGQSQGNYDLRVTFRAAVDTTDTIQDMIGSAANDVAVGFDGDGDGLAGGTYDFWFQTRPLNRTISFNAGAFAGLEGRTVTVTGASGATQVFEFSIDATVTAGRIAIPYTASSTAGDLANSLANAIQSRAQLNVGATANGVHLTLVGERSIVIDSALKLIDVAGKTIFVDKSAGPNADGSLLRPFNNISASGVPNAFAASHPGDIVRIVGNGGSDGNLATEADNFAYEIGTGLLPGSVLSDGATMDVPKGVTTMIDAGAVFKLRGARIGVGSSNLSIDRSDGALQVLGAPVLLDSNGNALRQANGSSAEGRVYFTSWLDESIGFDTYSPTTVPAAGNWGGISFRRDVDAAAGRHSLEDEGIFLQYVNHADIRYGGGTVTVESIPQTVNPIQMVNTRPTITDNRITRSSSAAMSAAPNSFQETNFNEPRFQLSGEFTSDYDRVGPEIRRNTLLNNSINALFIRVDTLGLTVPGRFDDIDIVHVITDNVIVNGTVGGPLLDSTSPPIALVSVGPSVGGTLLPGLYNYKVTYVDRNGYESVPSDASVTINLQANQTAISIAGLPSASGDFVERKLYRSQAVGKGPYDLISGLDRTTSTFLDIGQSAGGTLSRDRANISAVALTPTVGGSLAAGSYTYRIVMVDAGGREGLASDATSAVAIAGANRTAVLTNLPLTLTGYVGRRIYRSSNGGTSPYQLVGELLDAGNSTTTAFSDTGATIGGTLSAESFGVKRPRLNASLVIDPGTVLKLEAARIEATFGANIIAEGTDGQPIVFTSQLDDTVGAGGTFDTNNNGSTTGPAPRDWGGIYVAPTARLSVDFARFAYGGGVTKLDSTFRAFNTIEVHQGEARIANSLFENNADGFGGQGPGTRNGRLSNEQATIFVRGTQPVIVDNIFRGNAGSAITIDSNSMTDDLMPDPGRQTGAADRNPAYLANRGPLIRNNRMLDNDLNGLKIRAGDVLTTASVWDDTDIVHVVFNEIFVGNVQHESGLRLQSAPNESLVVKFDGYGSNFNRNIGAGLTANGQLTSATDRVGGSLHLLGQPGFPVILTSLFDDTVGAGLQPDGRPQTDTNNDGIGSIPQAADWRGILLDQYSNDRNVAQILETEDFTAAAPGANGRTTTAQVLGNLAPSLNGGDEDLKLGFVVEGVLSQSEDIDVYSFTGTAGAEVWLDIDNTLNNLDLVLELLDANGNLLARSDNSTAEATNPALLFVSGLIDPSAVNPLATRTVGTRTTSSGAVKEDGTTNPLDPGMRVRLPGSPGNPSTFFVRIRSSSTNVDAAGAGLTSGSYQLQVRLQEAQEWAGSTINYADIRYAMNGVHLRGLPGESPLIGEAAEDEAVGQGAQFANNGVATGNGVTNNFFTFANVDRQIGNRPQYVGNILETAKGAISVAGNISSNRDVDFYMLSIDQQDLVGGLFGGHASVVFDLDYADGLNRPDTSLNIFQEEPSQFGTQYRLIYSSDSSNIADDQGRPLSISDVADLSRGSVGTKDPYIGPIALPEGNYLVGISSAAYQPRTRIINPSEVKPISSVRRIVDESFNAGVTTADPPVVQNFLPRQNIGATGELVSSKTFNLGEYAAADLPALYLDYTALGSYEVFIKDSSGAEFKIASTLAGTGLPASQRLTLGSNTLKIPLTAVQAVPTAGGVTTRDFAGQDGLSVIVRSNVASDRVDNIIVGFAERGEIVGVGDEPLLLAFGNIFAPSGAAVPPFVRGAPGSFTATRQFSLVTYDSFNDAPQVAFDYEVFNGQMDVFIIDETTGIETRIATTVDQNRPANVTLLTTGSPQSAVLDISNFAGRSQLHIDFRARNDDPSRTQIRNVLIQLADGSRVGSGEPNSTYVGVNVPSTTVNSGNYQLEIRLGDEFFQSNSFGSPTLTKSFDTNDRLAEQITLIAPAGSDLTNGDMFQLSDGGRSIIFEFTTNGVVGLGNVPVRFASTDPAFVVARAIRDAVNSTGVQSQISGSIRAASSGGIQTGTTGRDTRVDLHGTAYFRSLVAANPNGAVNVKFHEGSSDRNARREQAQIIIQNSFIRESRDYGVWSEAPARLLDPRDIYSQFSFNGNTFSFTDPLQDKPNLVGTQAVRNLLLPNDDVQGGMTPGLVVRNNVLEEGGLGGVIVQGEAPIWMISPALIPDAPGTPIPNSDNNPNVNVPGNNPPASHFGSYIDDGDLLVIDADRTRIRLEFEDLANPEEGDGYAISSSIAYYRRGGALYQRLNTSPNYTPFATNAYETVHALRDAVLASILVSNGTTQIIKATVAESLLGPDPFAPPSSATLGYPEYFNRPALYLEGVSNLQWIDVPTHSNPFDIRQLDLGETPQPQARIVNNTIIGTDGRASFNGQAATDEPNDTIATAIQTWQGTSHNPLEYSSNGIIGDTTAGLAGTDVDIYQFKLGLGERVIVDVDSSSGLDSVLQIFDSRGIPQAFLNAAGQAISFSDNNAAPGETLGLDPYGDFTVTAPGVYYAAISSVGNTSYDPLSFANRQIGTTTGTYSISVGVRHLQEFVITAEDASAYASGDTFTIFGVPDIGNTGSSGRTFEFVIGGGGPSNANNIPINLNPDWRFPDVAVAIAKAINEGGVGRTASISNQQVLPNGIFGTASPLPPVHARALGGISAVIDAPFNTIQGDKDFVLQQLAAIGPDGISGKVSDLDIQQQITGPFYQVNQGLPLFTRRVDGFVVSTTTTLGGVGSFTNISSLGHLGLGHDRESTNPISWTSRGDGASEKFVVINNAAWIDGNGRIIVDPDDNANNNLDQLLPETGVLATRGASPTILNNVFFNLQTPVVNSESRANQNTGALQPFGSNNPNVITKPGDVVLGGSIYQYYEPGVARLRFGTGIETVPTNIPNTALDQNFDIANGVRLFVNAQAGQYLPAPGSPLIDSAINQLDERPSLASVKTAMGLNTSNLVAPDYDLVGQLRADDPAVSPPGGVGQNVFKDRGALDRADFIGPAAILLDPTDNDALGIDQDGSDSVVSLTSGVYPQFRIQLADGNEPANPLLGVGIDDNTVVSSIIPDKRLTGAAVVVFEDGVILQEGIDYSFAYNSTRDEIILTPLAGVWKSGKVYEISVNNKDRFVITAPSGDQVADGDQFSITDQNGGVVVYEFESGYRLQVPQGLAIQIPLAGGAFGGITDGDRFSLFVNGLTTTFEFDRNGNVLGGNRRIDFVQGATQQDILNSVIAAIQAAALPNITPIDQGAGRIFIGAEAGTQINTTFSSLTQPNSTIGFRIPDSGPRGGVLEGHIFSVSDGRLSQTFEYDTDGNVGAGNVAVDFSTAVTAADIAVLTQAAIANSSLNLSPTVVAGSVVHLGLGPNGSASIGNSQLALVGVARTLADGENFTISGNGKTVTFELTRDATVGSGNVPIAVSATESQTVISNRIVNAIIAADLGLAPKAVGDGNIAVGGSSSTSIDTSAAPGLSLFGNPGVTSRTQLQVFGPLLLQVPPANTVIDGSTIALQGNGRTVIFEFDGNNSGASQPGNVVISFNSLSSSTDIANALAAAINVEGLGIFANSTGAGQINLGRINASQLQVGSSGFTANRGVVTDGETFTISNGTRTVTFEFDNVDSGSGFIGSNTPILYSNSTTSDTLVQSMKAAIEGAGLGLTTTVLAGARLQLNDTPLFVTNISGAPTLNKSGVPGGANPVLFIQDPSFTGLDMKQAIIDAINASSDTSLIASERGGDSLFVSNAAVISPEIESYFLRGVADLGGNLLKPNRINNETEFTILMPGVSLDYGDAPDPLSTTLGRYPTIHANDGARHVVGTVALLGSAINAEADGQPSPNADADGSDDGVVFGAPLNVAGVFNRNVFTPIDVTLSSPGYVDAWIDFNADGDWDDPGEQILSARFTNETLSQTFSVTVPATAPIPSGPTKTFARFRSSSQGGLVPTGLAVDGEVEDYAVTIVPGTPPTAVNDTYSFNEDPLNAFTTTDANGSTTPGFTIDDGVAANDVDPEGGPLSVSIVQAPAFAQPGSFSLAPNGTFTYRPLQDFNGSDTFVYRVNDGVLGSNNLGTVTLIVREVNDAPIAFDDNQSINEGQTLEFDQAALLQNDSAGPANESTQTLTVTSVDPTSAQGGSVTLVAGRIRYIPPANFSGQDTFNYVVTDNGTTAGVPAPLSSGGTVTIELADRNNPPIVSPKSLNATEDTPATMTQAQLLAGDLPGPADESGQQLVISSVTPTSTNGGTVTFVAGVATYTPAPDFEGIDTFFYQVQDNGTSGGIPDPQTSTGTVTVTVAGVQDAPRVLSPLGNVAMAEDQAAQVIDLSTIFRDPDAGDSIAFAIVTGGNSNPNLVTPTINGNNLTLQLLPDRNGQATVVVRATDGNGASVTDTLTLTVSNVNDSPRLALGLPDMTVNEDDIVTLITLSPTFFFDPDVLSNGDVLTFEVVGNTNPLLVTPVINGNQLQMTLGSNRSGFADIRISAKDASGATIIDEFRLTVLDVNDVPVTRPDSYRVRQGETLTTTDPRGTNANANDDGVLANDIDQEGATLTATIVSAPQSALQFSLNANGTFTYQHDFSKGRTSDSFTYRASDGTGFSAVTTVTITIDNPSPPLHQNPSNGLDVNADGSVSPIDALLIINLINERGGGIAVSGLPAPPPYRDVDGNNIITANDVLQVINFLNSRAGSGNGEGESELAMGQLVLGSGAFPSHLVISTNQNSSLTLGLVAEGEQTVQPTNSKPAHAVFAQIGESTPAATDVSWVDARHAAQDRSLPIDFALASLLAELGENGDS